MGEVTVTVEDSIAIVSITNVGKRNAWTRAMRREFVRILADCGDGTVDCQGIVITGGAPEAFCAGQDLDDAVDWSETDIETEMAELKTTYDAVRFCPKPVVAAINAVAAGSGFQVALCSDSIVSHPDARMGQPEVRSGMASAVGARLLQMCVGYARMKEMILSGRLLFGHEAHNYGLVTHLVPSTAVVSTAKDTVRRFAAVPAESFAGSKIGLAESFDSEFLQAFADTVNNQKKLQVNSVAKSLRNGTSA
ncbi:enoyl-CoA hydratase/isomerase family protein [Brevibacterium sp.]|uniref:enoyl-CoA hydratase/isomerase family protein n=1 Tax=Brevibacterium sp. TaxID=1701 RepID=UPI002810FF5B|nr:enoyl-CoA hydratase/isomerase family protein [Brevibacterium sp.]